MVKNQRIIFMADEGAIIDENVDRLGGCGMIGCGVGAALFVIFGVLTLLTGLLWPIINQSKQADSTVALTLSGPEGEVLAGSQKFTGNGTPNSTIELDLNDVTAATTAVGTDGLWSITTDVVESGNYTVVAHSGEASSNQLQFNIGEKISAVDWSIPTLVLPAIESIEDLGKITISGVGSPTSNVDLLLNGMSAGRAAVDKDGEWSLDIGVSQYRNELQVMGLQPNEIEIGLSDSKLLLIPAAAADLTFDGVPQLQNPTNTGAIPFQWTGNGEPMADIAVELEGKAIGNTSVDADGNWSIDGELDLDSGNYNMMASMSIESDELARSAAYPITISTPVETIATPLVADSPETIEETPIAAIETPITEGDSLLTILSVEGGSTPYEVVSITVQAKPNELVSLVVEDESFALVTDSPTDVDGSLTYAGYFAAGEHTLVATSTEESSSYSFTVGNLSESIEPTNNNESTIRLSFVPPTGEEETDQFLAGSPAVELIADASWSMTFPLDSNLEIDRVAADSPASRISIAKSALQTIVEDLPKGSPVALRAFGNLRGNLACQTDLMIPLTPLDSGEFNRVVRGIVPQFNANTAIAASLAQVGIDLESSDREKLVVLLTDGQETCGGDPAAEIQSLVDQDMNIRVNVVGFAISDNALREEFQSWATIGGGEYYDAADADELADALGQALTIRYRVKDKNDQIVATGIMGGRDIDIAPGVYQIDVVSDDEITWQNVVITSNDAIELVRQ